MTTTIVVPHYGSADLTLACVKALEENTEDYELVVVDNGTGQPLPGKVLRNQSNRGFAVACNQGAAVGGPHIVFLNNDTEVRAGWLESLLGAMEEDVAAAGSLLVYPDGAVQHGGIRFYRNARDELTAENIREQGRRRDVEAVTGACMLVDRAKFWAVGGFDTGFVNGYEDVDLCLAFRQIGWRVIYEPASVVMHHESASGRERWIHVRENIARLQQKWVDYAWA